MGKVVCCGQTGVWPHFLVIDGHRPDTHSPSVDCKNVFSFLRNNNRIDCFIFLLFSNFCVFFVTTGELVGDASDRLAAQSRRTQSCSFLSDSDGRHLLEFGQLSRRYRDCRRAQVNIQPIRPNTNTDSTHTHTTTQSRTLVSHTVSWFENEKKNT